jgi:hypothetical protein
MASNAKLIGDGKLERVRSKASVATFVVVYQHFPGVPRENDKEVRGRWSSAEFEPRTYML